MSGFDLANTRHRPAVDVPTEDIEDSWRYPLDGNILSEPTVDHSTVFATAGTSVFAIDGRDGSKRWKTELDAMGGQYSPAVGENLVFVGCRDGSKGGLSALRIDTGEPVWSLGHPVAGAPVVTADTVYFGTAGDEETTLQAVRVSDGEQRWRFPMGRSATIAGRPAFSSSGLFTTSTHGNRLRLTKFSRAGEDLWSITRRGKAGGPPVVGDGRVFFLNKRGLLYAVDEDTGEQHWSFETDADALCSPALTEDTIYLGDLLGTLYAIDTNSATERWSASTQIANIDPTVGGSVVLAGGSPLLAFDRTTGKKLWENSITAHSYTFYSPVVTDDSIFVGACTKSAPQEMYDNSLYKFQSAVP